VPAVVVALVPAFDYLAAFSWFIGAAIAAAVHWAISRHDTSIAESVAAAAAAEPASGSAPEARI
jgi:NCS1 family nucleobase:cation symporter-1